MKHSTGNILASLHHLDISLRRVELPLFTYLIFSIYVDSQLSLQNQRAALKVYDCFDAGTCRKFHNPTILLLRLRVFYISVTLNSHQSLSDYHGL